VVWWELAYHKNQHAVAAARNLHIAAVARTAAADRIVADHTADTDHRAAGCAESRRVVALRNCLLAGTLAAHIAAQAELHIPAVVVDSRYNQTVDRIEELAALLHNPAAGRSRLGCRGRNLTL